MSGWYDSSFFFFWASYEVGGLIVGLTMVVAVHRWVKL